MYVNCYTRFNHESSDAANNSMLWIEFVLYFNGVYFETVTYVIISY